jgi:N-methylhydantoinase B
MGAGKFRGGAPFRREYKFLETEGVLQVRSDRRDFRPYGLYGGSPGKPSMNYFVRGDTAEAVPSKLTVMIHKGEVFRHEVAGAGGWGDPLERDPAAVLRDVRNGFVSLAAARDSYGVVMTERPLAVDGPATEVLRVRMAAARGWTKTPPVLWDDPDTVVR